MSKKTIFIVVILIILFSIFFLRNETEPMANPAVVSPVPSATINRPEEIKYDSATDLKKELESINPAVSESDFE